MVQNYKLPSQNHVVIRNRTSTRVKRKADAKKVVIKIMRKEER
jgi:hypothetical protein